ncbi:hypothetical protein E6A55_34155 (plasmid) [Cupriavidus necator H16]|uniref:Uncharacterized protein n=1 Tax=Cupriavidus necator (strain ATCC 17699 / DSM 428 / KCTC 22496 / NCIMB 10442 / H16 / Stanier 337) TaxID=381666 RepID=A0AAE5ZNN6_CUPNH|nr:hypothetical protein [Cupriavidus necator]QCC05598.1 hypothetical protein E6A55_34155 [Cupriavidus necator H16]QQB81418.1 hypothetical protein I6H87_34085 [Cupriavidus necator]
MSNKAMATVSKLALAGLRHGAGAVAGARRGAKQIRRLLPADSFARSAAQRRCAVSRHAGKFHLLAAMASNARGSDVDTR